MNILNKKRRAAVPPRPGRIAALDSQSPRMAKPRYSRDQQKIRRRQDLLDAAWILFCDKGYEAVTIDEVADHAGCSRQPVYSLFGDKQTLFFELHRAAIAGIVDMLGQYMPPGALLRDSLRNFAQYVAQELDSDRPNHGHQLFFVVQTIALSRPDIADRVRLEAHIVLDAIARGVRLAKLAEGEQLRGKPEEVAAHIAAIVNGMTTVQFQTHLRYTNAQDLADILAAIAFR